MFASQIMNRHVVTVTVDTPIADAISLMLNHRISGLPVLDRSGDLAGIITEGDLLRRSETGTQRRHSWWWSWLHGAGVQAGEYVQAHTRKVSDLMTDKVLTVEGGTPLDEIVDLMESKHVKRLPVTQDGDVVGVVSRSDLLRAVADAMNRPQPPASGEPDDALEQRILAELDKQPWFARGRIKVEVEKGIVTLTGVYTDIRERDAMRVAAENVPGVTAVRVQLEFLDPNTGALYG